MRFYFIPPSLNGHETLRAGAWDFTQRIIARQPVPFQVALYLPEHSQRFKTEHSGAKLERAPKEKHRFILTIDGVNAFQRCRYKAKELLAKVGIKPKEPKRGPSLGR